MKLQSFCHLICIVYFKCVFCSSFLNNHELVEQYYLLCGGNYFCSDRIEFRGGNISLRYEYMYSGVCPECKCDTGCLLRGDCCPDLYFSLPELSCVNRTIIEGNSEENRTRQSSALMVTSCPTHSDGGLREKCTSLKDTKSRLIHHPVTGNDWPLSFYNKYCAECNGVTNYTSWALDIDCKITADFNYMSSLDEIIDAAFSNQCLFQAYRDVNESEAKEEYCFDENEKGSVISECPKKGFAKQNDLEIKHACESSYKLKFRIFKNVFCYMCNPTEQIFMTKNLDTCNETGQWLTLDRDLQRACQELPSSPYTQPYKNIFCYLCNRGHDPQRSFLDIHSELTETILEVNERDLPDNYDWQWPTNIEFRWLSMMENDARWRYGYQLKIKAFDLTFFKLKLLRRISDESDSEKVMTHSFDVASFRDKNGVERNMTKMLLQGLALNGTLNICNSRRLILPTDKFNTCECELSCIFGPNPAYCCLDLALETPVNCFDIGQFSSDDFSHPHYLTLNGCLQEKRFKVFENECSNPKTDDIFSRIPLTKGNYINFANFYCVLCNLENKEYINKMNMRMPSSSKHNVSSVAVKEYLTSVLEAFTNVVDSYDIWNLEIACYKPLDYSHILTAGDFLQLSRRMRCRIRYEPIGEKSKICTTKYSYTNCEIPSKWTFTDKDVQWACKNASALGIWNSKLNKSFPKQYDKPNYRDISSDATYKNLFCALCKPEFNSLEMLDRNCTKQQYESQCLDVPVIYYYYPFKNVYCARCHGIENGTSSKPIPILSMTWNRKLSPPVTGSTWFPLLRNLFSLSDFETEDEHEHTNSSTRCGRNQVFDNNQGRCRIITCYSGKYLTGNSCLPLLQITTNLRYSLRIQLGVYYSDSVTHVAFLPKSFEEFKNEIDLYLSAKGISGEILGTTEKFMKMGTSTNNMCWYIRVEIFVTSSVSRLHIENNLIELKNTIINGCRKIRHTDRTQYRRLMYEVGSETGEAFITSYETRRKLFLAKVSEVLLCQQIKISSDEYKIDDDTSKLVLLKDGSEISFDEYDIAPDGTLRICLDRLEEMNYFDKKISNEIQLIQKDYQLYYLWIISLGCSGTSLFSLLLGLVIYAMVPALHNAPGKLLMTTMASLFFTLMTLQMSYFVIESRPACIAMAVILHFSWLSVFTSMQASNFHMFRRFTANDPQRHSSIRFFDKTFLKYLIYIFGLPLLFLLCNVLVAWLIHSDDDFGYGGRKCFINNNYRLLATFIIPIALICIVNIIFLLCTIRAIHLTPNPQSSHQNRNELAIYIRLTSTTGISWLLQVIDSFLPLTPFSFVVTSINSLQGFFIFIAFIVNKRMIKVLREKISKQKTKFTSGPTLTTDKAATSSV